MHEETEQKEEGRSSSSGTSSGAGSGGTDVATDDLPAIGSNKKEDSEDEEKPWPTTARENTFSWDICRSLRSLYSNWSFNYMDPILKKGRSQFKSGNQLHLDDLYSTPDYMKANVLADEFWRHYRTKKAIFSSLLKLAAPAFVPAGIWEFIYIVSRVGLPLSLRHLLMVLEEHESSDGADILRQGLPFALTLSASAFLAALAQNRTIFLSTQSGIMLRGALTTAIYEHALKLTPAGREGLTTGEVTNLVAVDTQKLYDVMVEGHNIWSCPVIITVVSALLWVLLGPQLVVGVVMLILFVPVVQQFVQRMLRIRKERSELTDIRINTLSAMLQGIRVTKLNHYEGKVEEKLIGIRNQEMQLLRRELRMWGCVLSTAVVSPLLAFGVAVSFYVLASDDRVLSPSDAFAALLLFSILRFPINLTARLVGKLAQSLDSARRIEAFLDREVRSSRDNQSEDVSNAADLPENVIEVKNCSFAMRAKSGLIGFSTSSFDSAGDQNGGVDLEITEDGASDGTMSESQRSGAPFVLRDISLAIKKSQVAAVVGKIGSGKSMLLRALLGEIPPLTGTQGAALRGKIAYSAQEPFILNATLRENILFGSPYLEQRYNDAIDACSLQPDIDRLGSAGDLTEIGERGVTLSGGQKARVALARSLYRKPDVALLDDVFSALDSNTAHDVFEGLFGVDSRNEGMLRSSGTLLVTHAVHFLPRVDLIVVVADGSPTFYGTWAELQRTEGASREILDTVNITREKGESNARKRSYRKHREKDISDNEGLIMTTEEREYGIASLAVWATWFQHAGGWLFVFTQILLLVFDRGLYILSDWWIATWSNSVLEGQDIFGIHFPPQMDGRSAQSKYLAVYAIIIALSTVASVMRSLWAVAGGARCANTMFKAMTHTVLRAPMSYFETTPLGRVLNRFTHDVEVLDIELSVSMTGLMLSFSWLMSSVIVMVSVLPWIFFALLPVSALYYFIQNYYRMSGPDLQRLDAVSRSPIQARLAEGLDGCATIRAFRKETYFAQQFASHVNRNCAAMLNFIAAQRWLGLRIEFLGATISLIISVTIVCANDALRIPAALVGLLILWGVIFSAALNFFFLRFTESEARITSIERIQRMIELPQEPSWETDRSNSLKASWPAKGELVFDAVCLRYRPDLPRALDSVSFKLAPGSRCGVVGRTGSGKTTLTTALFRIVESESGRILVDGVDLSKIGLSDVRGRKGGLRIIPQDPVLFPGTLRDCIDPFRSESDSKLLDALQAVNYRDVDVRGMKALDDVVEEDGMNFSLGERQLLCMARAIVDEPALLVLDEATASIDAENDALIQTMLRERFRSTTLLTVAHRLDTIMDYDVVLVMEGGRAVEFASPADLLDNADGIFSDLVKATGAENAARLRTIAESSRS